MPTLYKKQKVFININIKKKKKKKRGKRKRKRKHWPEPRIERGTSRRCAWVISLSENHTTRPPGQRWMRVALHQRLKKGQDPI